MGKINMKLMQGIEDTENQIQKDKQPDSELGKSIAGTEDTGKSRNGSQRLQKSQEQPKAKDNAGKSKKAENKPNMKLQKQVFSFRANVSDISIWKAYAIATGKTMENIGTAAINEYIRRHKLTVAELAVFDAIKMRNTERGSEQKRGGR